MAVLDTACHTGKINTENKNKLFLVSVNLRGLNWNSDMLS